MCPNASCPHGVKGMLHLSLQLHGTAMRCAGNVGERWWHGTEAEEAAELREGAPLAAGDSPSACMRAAAACTLAWLWLATISSALSAATAPRTRATQLRAGPPKLGAGC